MKRILLAIALAGLVLSACGSTPPQTSGSAGVPVASDRVPNVAAPRVAATSSPTASVTPMPVAISLRVASPAYVFPISPPSSSTYGRSHHDYPATDIFAPCGTDVVAVTNGTVDEESLVDEWASATDDPALRGGLSVTVVGDDGVRYYASHLLDIVPAVTPGVRVAAGEVIAHVGDTGNAAGTGCHVHFGLSPDCGPGDWALRRGTLYPWPYLDDWRDGIQQSPAADVQTWLADHGEDCASPPA